MAKKSQKLMMGVNNLIEEINRNHSAVFNCSHPMFDIINKKNDSHLGLLIPDEYWETPVGSDIKSRLKLNTIGATENRSELSNLLTATDGHTGVKGTRQALADDLAGKNYCFLEKSYKNFMQIFSLDVISENFSLKDLPKVNEYLMRYPIDIKKRDNGSPYSSINDIIRDIDCFHKTLLYLCAHKKYSDFFWWLFLYSLFQVDITRFIDKIPQIQYKYILNRFYTTQKDCIPFHNLPMMSVKEGQFWDIRHELVESAKGHLIIAGPSLRDAFSVDNPHTIVDALKKNIESGALTKVSILITDPIVFDSSINCGDPIRDISDTIETLQERFYNVFEDKQVELRIYFLPLLQIDHAVITEEFMVFRSNKLWNRERKFKGGFTLHLADYYTGEASEYKAHKDYLTTVMDNSTRIYPSVDVDYAQLDKTSARSKHMHWRRYLIKHNFQFISLYKVYEKQILNYVCGTWSPENAIVGHTIFGNSILRDEDFFNPLKLLNDDSQRVLLPYLKETQRLFDEAIKKHDNRDTSYCRIFPSLDLGFPNNVQRLAGGFATGMLVTWQCGIDIIPIDATVNVCTSSVFRLENFNPDCLQDRSKYIKELEDLFSDASSKKGYSFSFTTGNHFLIIAQDKVTKDYYLILHSSANEFKNSYMGLYPVEGNWYADKIKIIRGDNGRYFRYLKDEEARHFITMVGNFQKYNEQIHTWLARRINGSSINESESWMKHHYYMPTSQSIALGTFAEPIGTEVPLFSAPGKPIYIFKIGRDNWQVNLGGSKGKVCLVPHGWGQKIKGISNIKIRKHELILTIGSEEKRIAITSKQHINCAEKVLRDYEDGYEFLKIGENYVKGVITKELIPCFEYSQHTTKKGC